MVISTRESNAINILKTALAIGIVLSHSSFYSEYIAGITHVSRESQAFDYFVTVLQSFTCVCVPLFFFISGYLFFLNVQTVNFDFFKKKISKRFLSLMIPFFIANLLAFLLVLIANTVKHNIIPIGGVSLTTISTSNILSWLLIHPLLGPTWFLRDLFVVVLFSPVIYGVLKNRNVRIISSILLLLIWGGSNYLNYSNLGILNQTNHGICFFSIGSAVALSDKHLFFNSRWIYQASSIVAILCIIVIVTAFINREIVRLPLIISLGHLYCGICYYFSRDSYMAWTQEALVMTFFVYIYHGILVIIDKQIVITALNPVGLFHTILAFLLIVLVLFAQLLLLYYILKKICPRFLAMMVGGR